MPEDPKETLVRYLQAARDAMVWKLEGLSEYDVRRPMTPTGTNLLGLVQHLASVELGYLGDTFGRPGEHLPWHRDDADPNEDMWVSADQSREDVLALYRRAWAHGAETLDTLGLESPGEVPWWPPERREVTLHQVLVHMVAETARHAGHADILREAIDGAAGRMPGDGNLDLGYDWAAHHQRVERAAREASTLD